MRGLLIEKPEFLAVVDTNVIISALLFRDSEPRRALSHAFERGAVLSSSKVRNELREVCSRPKFDRYVPKDVRMRELEEFIDEMESVRLTRQLRICRDPRDDQFLELALAGSADYLITGDADLLALRLFHQTTILTPTAYLAR